jgi:hypothetical protein
MGGGSADGMGGAGGAGGGGIRGVSGPIPGPDAMGGGAGGPGGTGSATEGMQNCDPNATGGYGGPDEECTGGVGQYPGESEADRKARLEKTLEESVGGFDEVLADEQREISTVGRNTEGFGGAGGGGAGTGRVGLGKQATGGSGGGGGGGGSGAGAGATVAMPSEEREASVGGLSEDEIKSRTPDDIPDLVSEDIVAKQLREAALSEDDPELRERLWEEYRIYNDL